MNLQGIIDRLMTISRLVIFFIIFAKTCFAQDIKNLCNIYQSVLDNESFIDKINSQQGFTCDSILFLNPTDIDSTFRLKFNDRPVLTKKSNDTSHCPTISFRLTKTTNKNYTLYVKVCSIKNFEKSVTEYFVDYSCVLKKRKDLFIIKNEKVLSGYSNGDYL